MRRPSSQPYRQGDLDGLCGIYAVINAIRLALGKEALEYSDDNWRELFCELVLLTDETIGAVAATTCGIGSRPYRELLQAAVRYMANEYDVRLKLAVLLPNHDRPRFADLAFRLQSIAREPGTALIVSFEGHLDHWTVIRGVSDHWLQLHDSASIIRLSRANCRMSYEPPLRRPVEHVIRPSSLFWLKRS